MCPNDQAKYNFGHALEERSNLAITSMTGIDDSLLK